MTTSVPGSRATRSRGQAAFVPARAGLGTAAAAGGDRAAAGVEALCEVDPPPCERAAVVTPPDAEYGRLARPAHEGARALAELLGLDGAASNNWAVAGSRTASGAPILAATRTSIRSRRRTPTSCICTAPSSTRPARRCQVCRGSSGATTSGSPGVRPPRCRRCISPWWRSSTKPATPRARRGGWAPIERCTEQISVSGYDDETIELRTSVNGPIVSEVLADDRAPRWAPHRAISLHSPVLWPSQSGHGDRGADAGDRLAELLGGGGEARRLQPGLRVCGHRCGVGLRVSGAVPAANAEALRFPVAGWLPAEQGGVPQAVLRGDQLPHTFNPPGALVVSANNPLTPRCGGGFRCGVSRRVARGANRRAAARRRVAYGPSGRRRFSSTSTRRHCTSLRAVCRTWTRRTTYQRRQARGSGGVGWRDVRRVAAGGDRRPELHRLASRRAARAAWPPGRHDDEQPAGDPDARPARRAGRVVGAAASGSRRRG